jgi:hypothetical protein
MGKMPKIPSTMFPNAMFHIAKEIKNKGASALKMKV